MNRPGIVWTIFGVAVALVLAAMTAVSVTTLRLERGQLEAQRQAELEEKVRLALWRMDSAVAPLILEESSRPYFTYSAFFPADRAYEKTFGPTASKEIMLASPLLTQTSSNVLLHFQYGPDGGLSSPQVPAPERRLLATAHASPEQIERCTTRLNELQKLINPKALAVACVTTLPEPELQYTLTPQLAQIPVQVTSANKGAQQQALENQQIFQNQVEFNARNAAYANVAQSKQSATPASRANIAEGIVKPIWFGEALVLARRVSVDGRDYLQGCWLDWPHIRTWLLGSVGDLLPNAQLEPMRGAAMDPQARLLASLPLRLVPGVSNGDSSLSGFSFIASPIKLALAISWLCMLLAAVAIGVLLHGAISLSERRGAFVSAVTHELRTPLTTFKMYSEMLAEGMVQDEDRKRQYLNTLCSEANRLGHLVENVLAYARLERGSARSRVESLSLTQLIDRVKPRLVQRADQAKMQLQVDGSPEALQSVVHVDVAAVEQILFNLVDNACKYAACDGTERVVHLEALPNNRFAMLRVRDHGQGISEEGARRLFKPFSKSAHEAAHTAPGVGLGLALCRRLSRSMGGDLRLDGLVKNGACFVLSLPLSNEARPATLA
jgi:signal transduction histidine kinase